MLQNPIINFIGFFYTFIKTKIMINLLHGDCLIESDKIESGSVDLILTDLPYGNMNTDGGRKMGINGWDLAIEPKKVFEIANRILRKNGKMILFSQEPYTTKLITKAIPNIPFGYRATWEKDNFAVALGAKVNMVSFTEDILFFSKSERVHTGNDIHPLKSYFFGIYNVFEKGFIDNLFKKEGRYKTEQSAKANTALKFGFNKSNFEFMNLSLFNYLSNFIDFDRTYVELKKVDTEYKIKYGSTFNLWEGKKYKSNILKYKKDYNGYHPTQKPILLLEDLIKTFSNENDLVVDLTIGSGSTGVACVNTNRNFIGIEKDENYFKIAKERINSKNLFTN
jgi:site-specific DNA-methyltransferase (adenine-specific)